MHAVGRGERGKRFASHKLTGISTKQHIMADSLTKDLFRSNLCIAYIHVCRQTREVAKSLIKEGAP